MHARGRGGCALRGMHAKPVRTHAPAPGYCGAPPMLRRPSPASVSGSSPGGAAAVFGIAAGRPAGAVCFSPGGALSFSPPMSLAPQAAFTLERFGPPAAKGPPPHPGPTAGEHEGEHVAPALALPLRDEELAWDVEEEEAEGRAPRPSPSMVSAMPVTKSSNSRAPGLMLGLWLTPLDASLPGSACCTRWGEEASAVRKMCESKRNLRRGRVCASVRAWRRTLRERASHLGPKREGRVQGRAYRTRGMRGGARGDADASEPNKVAKNTDQLLLESLAITPVVERARHERARLPRAPAARHGPCTYSEAHTAHASERRANEMHPSLRGSRAASRGGAEENSGRLRVVRVQARCDGYAASRLPQAGREGADRCADGEPNGETLARWLTG